MDNYIYADYIYIICACVYYKILIGSMKIPFISGTLAKTLQSLSLKSSQAFYYIELRKLRPQELK